MNADLVIVGGGIAGSALALGLARAGVESVVVEKQEFPRDKPCGEGLMPQGVARLAALDLGRVVSDVGGQPFRGILFRGQGITVQGDFLHGAIGYGVRRRLLDGAVHQAARESGGVTVLHGSAHTLSSSGEGATVTLEDGRALTARMVVGADGPRSVVRHAAGLDGGAPRQARYALRQHFQLARGVPLPTHVEVSAQGGYELYLTPSAPGTVGLAALCERKVTQAGRGTSAERLARLLESAPAPVRERLLGATPASEAMACGPLRVKTRGVSRGPVLLVGDAAGYVDAITGEGMSLALASAAFAAEAIVSWLRGGVAREKAMGEYARRRARLFRDHALITHGTVFVARHPRLARHVLSRLAREPLLFSRLLATGHGERSPRLMDLFDLTLGGLLT